MTTKEDVRTGREDPKEDLRVKFREDLREDLKAVSLRIRKQEGRGLLITVCPRTDVLKLQAKSLPRDLRIKNMPITSSMLSLSTKVTKY